ncbi:carbohydrate ABC transporter permease [Amnibacterium kyonggiense]|uniref:Carbohydrate ABC transporter membrane protein 1 (CUT1 family) n=1 Tax=Amnibacterium kyonggiense TaxID=595671 RepID=A0A4R7FR81_9MICO|nr:sugar ABC transporter permease [Amnibacterium kyonggiense]TDS80322.1 carbohydrate ABC transporter membrane protein 1 (CUT1 family) [Amnibacterium kyonggiense]
MTHASSLLVGRTAQSGPRGRRRPGWQRRLGPWAFLAPALVAVAVFIAYPIAIVAAQSLFDIRPTRHAGWTFAGVQNYLDAFADDAVWSVLGNSAIWTIGSVLLQFIVAMAAALLLQQLAGARILRAVFVLPWATPVVVGALAWKLLYQPDYGLINEILGAAGLPTLQQAWLSNPSTALLSVVVANVWRGFPFIMVLLLSGMASIPPDLYEAAGVDGATWARSFRSITLPLLKPVLLTSTLIALIWTFNNFSSIYVMTGGGPGGATDILTTFVYKAAFQSFDFGYASALSMILFAIVGIASALYIRAFGREALS